MSETDPLLEDDVPLDTPRESGEWPSEPGFEQVDVDALNAELSETAAIAPVIVLHPDLIDRPRKDPVQTDNVQEVPPQPRDAVACFTDVTPEAETGTVVLGEVSIEDAELVAMMLCGHKNAKAMFYDRYAVHVELHLVRVLGPDRELEDLRQDVFVSAYEQIEKNRLDDPARLKAWLTRITIFTAMTTIRKRCRWRPFIQFRAPEDVPQMIAPSISEEQRAALREVERVLGKLPADQRICFLLRHVDGMTLSEIANATDLSLATVKRKIKRAEATVRADRIVRRTPGGHALSELSADERICFVQRHVVGMTTAQIADLTGLSIMTVKRTLERAEAIVRTRQRPPGGRDE